ncbi:hypothetical protein BC829DRAFT_297170 [Chytridium lagenaria]|nr:hypothetical protein BC829DRAFT_297170 [Chytridium lagenaria]
MKFSTILAVASTLLFSLNLPSSVNARFGQEREANLGPKVEASGCRKSPGDKALGFGGQEIAKLLAGAGACDKVKMADDLLAAARTECENDAPAFANVVAAAMDLLGAEKNFNPFNGNLDAICTDATLPVNEVLRGIIPKVDPRQADPNNGDQALSGRAQALNTRATAILAAAKAAGKGPGAPAGVSIADLVFANGFDGVKDFTPKAGAVLGGGVAQGNQGNQNQGNQNQGNQNQGNQNQGNAGNAGADKAAKIAQAKSLLQQAIALLSGQGAATPPPANNNNNNNNAGNAAPPPATPPPATAPAAAAGQCADVRKMDFVVQGREHRFGIDNTQVALNPAIVVQQICDRANGQCKDICNAAGAALVATGVKGFTSDAADPARDLLNAQAADTFNKALGNPTNVAGKFAGVTTGSDGAAGNALVPRCSLLKRGLRVDSDLMVTRWL